MEKGNRSDCAILVNSCDAYSDVWQPFFTILKNRWGILDYPIYLNTESIKCHIQEFDVITINCPKKIEWGGRLINALYAIEEEFVLVLLEDFFFQDDVKDKYIYNCLDVMRKDSQIACMSLLPVGRFFKETNVGSREEYPGFVRRDNNEIYILCCEPALWRRRDLIYFTREWQNPWIWEAYGHHYVKKSKKKFYCRSASAEEIFKYDVERGGAIHRGKWVGCTVRPILEENGIDMDLDKRGVIEDWMKEPEVNNASILKKVKNRFFLIRSLLS